MKEKPTGKLMTVPTDKPTVVKIKNNLPDEAIRAALDIFLKEGFKIQVLRKDESIPGVRFYKEVDTPDEALKCWKRLGVTLKREDLKLTWPSLTGNR